MVSRVSTQLTNESQSTKDSTTVRSSQKISPILESSEFDKRNPWIETVGGRRFHFLNPRPEDIDIDDIAHALANTCRYTGHCKKFYSVAEHSVAVSELCPDAPLAGLLHDASEAYITDIASPVKPFLANYKDLEDVVMMAIANKYNFFLNNPAVKEADVVQLSTEARHLMASKGDGWDYWIVHLYGERPKRLGIAPRCLLPKEAKRLFLNRFEEIYGR
jgi:hypothetical protein